jgi:hypothetical protein
LSLIASPPTISKQTGNPNCSNNSSQHLLHDVPSSVLRALRAASDGSDTQLQMSVSSISGSMANCPCMPSVLVLHNGMQPSSWTSLKELERSAGLAWVTLAAFILSAVAAPLKELASQPTGIVAVVDATNVASANNSLPPSLVNAAVGNVVAISAAYDLASALTVDGRIEYWAVYGLKITTPVPDRVQGQAISPMSIGGAHNMVVTSGGNLDIWLDPPGQDKFGLRNVPAAVTNGSVQAVTAGDGHALVLTKGGSVIAWGLDADGQAQVPTIISAGGATMIAASFNSSLAITQVIIVLPLC